MKRSLLLVAIFFAFAIGPANAQFSKSEVISALNSFIGTETQEAHLSSTMTFSTDPSKFDPIKNATLTISHFANFSDTSSMPVIETFTIDNVVDTETYEYPCIWFRTQDSYVGNLYYVDSTPLAWGGGPAFTGGYQDRSRNMSRLYIIRINEGNISGFCTIGYMATETYSNPYPIVGVKSSGNSLSISKTGSGSGSITANTGSMIWNSNTGTAVYIMGESVTLTAAANSGSIFGGWQGCDSTNANQCTVTMSGQRTITATFNVAVSGDVFEDFNNGQSVGFAEGSHYSIHDGALFFQGDGQNNTWYQVWAGGINPGGWSPSAGQSNYFDNFNASVDVLWQGGADNYGYGLIVCTQRNSIGTTDSVRFFISKNGYYTIGKGYNGTYTDLVPWGRSSLLQANEPVNLSIVKNGANFRFFIDYQEIYQSEIPGYNGGGIGIEASNHLNASFDNFRIRILQECSYGITPTDAIVPASEGTRAITVTASSRECTERWTAESNDSWITITSGSSGTGSGIVNYSVSANQTGLERTGIITVAGQTFKIIQLGAQQRNLSVAVVGRGTVTSDPEGINCGEDCTEGYAQGTSVVLMATPSAGSNFEGWSGGGCSGIDSCTVILSADTPVSARFSAPRTVKLAPQVLMAGFDPILLDFATTRVRIAAIVREGNQPVGSVSITDNAGALTFAMNLIGSLSSGDLLYGAELSIDRGPDFSLPNLFGSESGQILVKAVDTTGLSHSFPTVAYGNNPDLTLTQGGTEAALFAQRGCKRLLPQVLMAGLEPTLLDFDDTEINVRAMVREGTRPIQDVSLKINNSSFNLAMDLVETLENGDRLFEKAIVFSRGSFGYIESDFRNLWGGGNGQFMIEVRDDAGQRHSFPDIRRGDYRTINANECWSDQ